MSRALVAAGVLVCCGCSHGGGEATDGGATNGGSGAGSSTGATSSGGSATTGGTQQGPCGLSSAQCNGVCVVTLTDPDNCGGCGVQCSASQVCAAGACASPSDCPPGFEACGQLCVDPLTDDGNCGSCGHTCGMGLGCSTGVCVMTVGLTGQMPTCTNGGPPTVLATDAGSTCAGNLAQTTFNWALCSCSTLGDNGQLTTDAFDSQFGPYVDGGLGAGVGANDQITLNGAFQVSGSLWTDATDGLSMAGGNAIGLELHDQGQLTAIGVASIGSNAYVNGDVTADGLLTIGGTLYVPTTATVGISSLISDKGQVLGPVSVPPPCACAPSQLIDVAALVAFGTTYNDDAIIGLNPDAFAQNNGGLRLDLPCGNYYLSSILSNGVATIAVHGHTAVFVGGDVDPNGGLEITLDPTATLDLFIGGNLSVNGDSTFGSALVPSQSRIYVAGSAVSLNGDVALAGNFYLPLAQVTPNGNLEIFGSLFTGSYQTNGTTEIHYDTAILNAGDECGDAGVVQGQACQSCKDCGNQACTNGSCAACVTSADCCAPLLCANGTCLAGPS